MMRLFFATLFAVTVALAPGLADARAGSGSSMGSRGGMTFTAPPSTRTAPSGAMPMERTMTAPSAPTGSPYGNQPNYAPRSSFGGGFMGGLIGGGILGLMLGHGMFYGGFGGLFGMLIQLAVIFFVARWLFRMFAGRSAVPARGPAMFTGQPQRPMGGGGGTAPPPITIGPQDYQQFEQLLVGIQAAWSARDLNGLRAMTTPEMLSYFNEQLSEQASRGVRNIVGDVRLQSGDLAQAWAERGVEYATVAMRFSMTDVTVDGANRVVDGNANEHVVATEIWTFMRARGGRWVLSAIQQAR